MFEILSHAKTVLALCEPGYDDAWNAVEVRSVIADYLNSGTAVAINAGGSKLYVIPEGRTVESVRQDLEHAAKALGV